MRRIVLMQFQREYSSLFLRSLSQKVEILRLAAPKGQETPSPPIAFESPPTNQYPSLPSPRVPYPRDTHLLPFATHINSDRPKYHNQFNVRGRITKKTQRHEGEGVDFGTFRALNCRPGNMTINALSFSGLDTK